LVATHEKSNCYQLLRAQAISTGGYIGMVRVYNLQTKTWRQWYAKLAIKE
jgi:hypothetical protein